MRLSQLTRAGREPALPLTLTLSDRPPVLTLHRLLRVLPGRRYVGVADWQGRTVLAKLLVGTKAQRHFQRERDGAGLLIGQKQSTPALLEADFQANEGGWLLFEYLDNAESLDSAWQAVAGQPLLSAAQRQVLGKALTAIAEMHSKGLWQKDLHLDNLLRQGDKIYLVDGGAVYGETPGQPLSRRRVLENLGVFFAQLPAALDAYLEDLLTDYRRVNGALPLPIDQLRREIAGVRRWRVADLMKKIGRDCSLFSVQRGPSRFQAVSRQELAFLAPLLADPDRYLATGVPLKRGGTATVARVVLDRRPLVIKRYNIKSFWHALTRCWRPSRAWTAWREGHRLGFLGIATAKPLAMLETRRCWLRGKAYLITESLDGEDIIKHFEPYQNAIEGPPENELQALDELFAGLIRERINHGDLKGNNLFWQTTGASGRWTLIDLDATHHRRTHCGFARGYARDRTRFLRNWPEDCGLHRLLAQRIPLRPAVDCRTNGTPAEKGDL